MKAGKGFEGEHGWGWANLGVIWKGGGRSISSSARAEEAKHPRAAGDLNQRPGAFLP